MTDNKHSYQIHANRRSTAQARQPCRRFAQISKLAFTVFFRTTSGDAVLAFRRPRFSE